MYGFIDNVSRHQRENIKHALHGPLSTQLLHPLLEIIQMEKILK